MNWPKNGIWNLCASKSTLVSLYQKQPTKMHWYDYNNTILVKLHEKLNILSNVILI